MSESSAFFVRDLTVGYDQETIINRMNITLNRGQLTALIGPNGCGKSTLLKSLARILKPRKGVIELGPGVCLKDLNAREVARHIALLPQSPLVPEGIRAFDLVAYGRAPHLNALGQLKKQDREVVQQAMARMDVHHLADRPVAQLSGGQRQRVWMAMIVAQQTEIVLLDEPTTYLDLAHQYDVLELVGELINEGRTVITVLHDLNQACRFADELVVMNRGSVIAQGAPEAVMSESMLAKVFGLDASIVPDPESGTPLCIPRTKRRSANPSTAPAVKLNGKEITTERCPA